MEIISYTYEADDHCIACTVKRYQADGFDNEYGEPMLRSMGGAVDYHGVNLFDTANMYSAGVSEEILGKALGDKRNDVLVTTKVRFPMGDGPNEGKAVLELRFFCSLEKRLAGWSRSSAASAGAS